MFISIEGIDNTGKTLQAKRLVELLNSKNIPAIYTREPGGTKICEEIRELILHNNMDDWTELLLFIAARNENYKKIILPSINDGKVVVCDRFIDSTVVYQGYMRGLSIEKINNIHKMVLGEKIYPDLTFIIDLDIKIAISRINEPTKFEDIALEKQENIRKGFLEILKNKKHRNIFLINGEFTIAKIAESIESTVIRYLNTMR